MLFKAIFIVPWTLTAPPINPFAWTKSMSSIPDKFFNFSWSLMPLHSLFRGFRSSKDPSFFETA